ncbi:oxidoreductase [Azonexus hydrophilus]|uniref:Oxidoreductase n=1 Tax=Azonexus hydrophilus TaxID=418702 RepID=A0A1R1I1A9_9RHOO|nr:DUF934 domain-containing protein [Azonexus hydrophilus]OMG52449.1 oxidoreductase [Azonexus hydrophilus]
MSQLIKQAAITVDTWKTLETGPEEAAETIALPAGDVIFPLAVWLARKNEIISCHKRIGLLLQPDERVEDVADDLDYFVVIAVNFPKFVDGRGYTTASLLRQRYHYQGELRAVGDILHDQLYYLKRVGFDAWALKDGKNPDYAVSAGFTTFSDAYQASTDQPEPYFRRRA